MSGGMSIRAMATVLGVSPTTVQKYRAFDSTNSDASINVGTSRGRDGRLRPDRRFDTTHRDSIIKDLRAGGLSVRQVAEAVGCSVGTVHRVMSLPSDVSASTSL
ncbi:hypothetical protein SAMN04515671_0077 [Nakamurella panacisegetis]|uniref:Helix-turn-helix domain of resolvase n=1 Tax=Nakamurella panacisegetis TaxID=1090615 RepID=A0A1H0HHN0_9ACTN|nr:hypothetical protein SAMN04515671_0077 [Nakamurella panacisegetis]